MRILAVADDEARYYYDFYKEGKLDEFDLIIACGDLSRTYLEFLVTMARCPLVYVRGNHDETFTTDPPEGCICIDDQIYVQDGVRIMGLGGSYRYNEKNTYMYTEGQMWGRVVRLLPQILWHRGFDILVTHAPARGINDFEHVSHRGFECFLTLMDRFHPKYFIHGHIHKNYGIKIPQYTQRGDTTIINAYEYCRFDYAPEQTAKQEGSV